jgi:hypothetical protein
MYKTRIDTLKNPNRLNDLFDLFEKDGMPMGNDQWIEYVINRWLELKAKEKMFNKITHFAESIKQVAELDISEHYRNRRKNLEDDFNKFVK